MTDPRRHITGRDRVIYTPMVGAGTDDPDRSGDVPGRLDLLKALGDNTRYAIYLELARSPTPLATADVAGVLGLHPNTVRPHLERMREVGLLDVRPAVGGGVGRPQHLYSLAADAPALGLEPPAYPLLATMLVRLSVDAGLDGEQAADAARPEGRRLAASVKSGSSWLDAVTTFHERLGFDPQEVSDGDTSTIFFANCPFGELAETNPEVICAMHRGLIEGFVDQLEDPATVVDFHDRTHREPCLVTLVGNSTAMSADVATDID